MKPRIGETWRDPYTGFAYIVLSIRPDERDPGSTLYMMRAIGDGTYLPISWDSIELIGWARFGM